MQRIIVVEDEHRNLSGRYGAVVSDHPEWEVRFVRGIGPANDARSESPPDLVVLDLGGLGELALPLLRELAADGSSDTLVLAGRADPKLFQRALPLSQHCAARPVDPSELESVISRMLSLRRRLSDPRMAELLDAGEALPPTPLYTELTHVVRSEGASPDHLSPILIRDPSIVDRMLELVNTSFGLASPVHDPREAIAILGPATLQALVLNLEVFRALEATACPGLDLDELHAHGLAGAGVASRLLQGTTGWNQARVAGLFHDVGRLVFAAARADDYSRVLARVRNTGQPLAAAEQRAFGVTHADLGAYAASLWGLPWAIVEPIAVHHDSSPAWFDEAFDARHAVYVAELLLNEGTSHEAASIDELAIQLAAHGLESEVAAWRDEVAALSPAPGVEGLAGSRERAAPEEESFERLLRTAG